MARQLRPGDEDSAGELPAQGQGKSERNSDEKAIGEGQPRTGERPDPTRYGDWEKNGRCIDF